MPRPAFPSVPLPDVDESACTGCGLCVAVCPETCLALCGPVPWLPRPRACTSCGACEIVCPEAAISFAPAAPAGP